MKTRRIGPPSLLFLVVVCAAAGLRFGFLHLVPLNNGEASLALNALRIAGGSAGEVGAHPLYLTLTAGLFYVLGATDWLARFVPALAGTLLVTVPWLLRKKLGERVALVLALLLAFDPGLVSASVQAGTSIITAAGLGVLAAGFFRRQAWLAGLGGAVLLLGGPLALPGMLGLGLALAVAGIPEDLRAGGEFYRRVGLWAAACFFILGTMGLLVPEGLAAWGNSLTDWFAGLTRAPEQSLLTSLAVFTAYELLIMGFAIAAAISGLLAGDGKVRFLAIWSLASLLSAALHPALAMDSFVWVILPLALLAAQMIAKLLTVERTELGVQVSQTLISGLVLLLLLNLLNAWRAVPGQQSPLLNPATILAGAALILVLETFLVAWGWSPFPALRGLGWGFGLVAGVVFLSASFHASGAAGNLQNEVWRQGETLTGAGTVMTTLGQQERWRPNPRIPAQVRLAALDSPAMEWQLRRWPDVQAELALTPDVQADFLLTNADTDPLWQEKYTGQLLLLSQRTLPARLDASGWIKWLLIRQTPPHATENNLVMLWMRTDLFPGATSQTLQP